MLLSENDLFCMCVNDRERISQHNIIFINKHSVFFSFLIRFLKFFLLFIVSVTHFILHLQTHTLLIMYTLNRAYKFIKTRFCLSIFFFIRHFLFLSSSFLCSQSNTSKTIYTFVHTYSVEV